MKNEMFLKRELKRPLELGDTRAQERDVRLTKIERRIVRKPIHRVVGPSHSRIQESISEEENSPQRK